MLITARYFVNTGKNRLKSDVRLSKGAGITPRNNEMKDVIKVIESSEKIRILIK